MCGCLRNGLMALAFGALLFAVTGEATAQVKLRTVNPRPPIFVKPTPLASQQATIANGGPIGGVAPLAISQFGAATGAAAANGINGAGGNQNQGANAFTPVSTSTSTSTTNTGATNINYLGYNGMQGPVPRLTAGNPNTTSLANQAAGPAGFGGIGSQFGGAISPGLGGVGGLSGGFGSPFGGGGIGSPFGGGGFGSPFGGGGLGGGFPGLGGGFIL